MLSCARHRAPAAAQLVHQTARRRGGCRMAVDSPSVLRRIDQYRTGSVRQSVSRRHRCNDTIPRSSDTRDDLGSVACTVRHVVMESAIPRLSSDVTWHGCDARRPCRSGAAARMECGSPSMAAQPRGTALLASARSGCAMMAGQSLWKAGALVVVDMRWWGIRFPFGRRRGKMGSVLVRGIRSSRRRPPPQPRV